ncbi:hypothetical protein D3C81_1082230 [compost metagenome]|jgi:hypothetical protein|uniref:hypothetical protein n=1 Tax=Pseudomonas putida TaxID=303 RepID=UPI000F93AEA3|nr:hypothetical protein [Pseudomonas putida]
MDDEKQAALIGFKQAARGQIGLENNHKNIKLNKRLTVEEIDDRAIEAHECWHPNPHDFGWSRVLQWKRRRAHAHALDIAIWHDNSLAGLCWASPLGSKEKIMVLYLQRNPDDRLATRGYIAPLCMSGVRFYALLLGLKWVVVKDPLPEARVAYQKEGFRQVKGIGLAYDLRGDYAALNHEEIRDVD